MLATVNGKSSLSEYNSKYKAKKGCLPIRDTKPNWELNLLCPVPQKMVEFNPRLNQILSMVFLSMNI